MELMSINKWDKMYKLFFFGLIPVFFLLNMLPAQQGRNHHSRVYERDEIFGLLNKLYILSGEVNPAQDYILTLQDAKDFYDSWKERNGDIKDEQKNIIQRLDELFSAAHGEVEVNLGIGIDYLHHTVPDCTQSDPFYNAFKDKDFSVKYENRERFFDLQVNMPLHKNLFLSTRTSFRNDWKKMNARQNDFPRDLKEININVNERAALLFHFSRIKLYTGLDRISVGVGNLGKLLVSEGIPETHFLQLQYRYKDKLAFNHYIASMRNTTLEDERPKIMYIHRITYRFFNRVAFSLSEMLMTNQSINAAYINPFLFFHNIYDYPEQRNVLTAADLEVTPLPGIKLYGSFAVDEIDVESLEENGDKGREAWGLLAGIDWVHPFHLENSVFTAEYVKLTEWLYNHGFPWFDYYTLNFVFEEKQGLRDTEEFHRFSGHPLGANAIAFLSRMRWESFDFHFRFIRQGEIPIFSRSFSRPVSEQKENRIVLGINYHKWFWNDKLELNTALFHTSCKDFHQRPGLDADFTEFWIGLKYNLFNFKWDMQDLF